MAVIPVKTAILVSQPFIGVSQQFTWPLQSWVVSYLHENVVYRNIQGGKVVESLIKSPSTPVLLSPVSVPLRFGPYLMGFCWTVDMFPFSLLS